MKENILLAFGVVFIFKAGAYLIFGALIGIGVFVREEVIGGWGLNREQCVVSKMHILVSSIVDVLRCMLHQQGRKL